MRKVAMGIGVGVLIVVGWSGAAWADTQTQHFTETDVSRDVNPCTGARGLLTTTSDGTVHVTSLASGGYHVTGTFTGDLTFDATKASQPDYSGHTTSWFGENDNTRNETGTFTFSFVARGTDGSTIRGSEVAHYTTNAKGVVTVSFDKATLNCP